MGSPEMVSIVHRAIDRERDAISVYLGLAKIVTEARRKTCSFISPPTRWAT